MFYVNYSWVLALLPIMMFIVMFIIAKPWSTYYNPRQNNVCRGLYVFFLLYILTCVFAFWAEDTYHSWDEFIEASHYDKYDILGYEEVYNWMAEISGNSYFLWRVFIWLPACIFLFMIIKKLELMHRNMLVSIALFGLMLSFTRGMLGHLMLVYGVIILLQDKSSTDKKSRMIGLSLFCMSYFFHKSMYVNIIFALLAFLPWGKKGFVISLVSFPFFVFVANGFVDSFLTGSLSSISLGDGVGGVGDKTLVYISGERAEKNTYGVISQIFRLIPEIIVILYLVNRIIYKKYFKGMKNEFVFTYLFRMTYVIYYISSLFAFVETSSWIYIRFKYMAFFPLLFVFAKVLSMESSSNYYIKSIVLLQTSSFFIVCLLKLFDWYSIY